MSKIKAVLFDLDGTLINTLTDLAGSTNYALVQGGYEAHPVEEYRYFVGNGARVMIKRALPEAARSDDEVERLLPIFLEHYGVHSQDNTAPYDGIAELVKSVRARGIKTAVVTNKPDAAAQKLIADELPNLFDFVTGQHDGVPTKPAPDMPLAAMKALGVEPDECVFMGDSNVDIQTGLNCGAHTVGVLWGFRDEKELRENGAKHIISRPEQLPGLLDVLESEGGR